MTTTALTRSFATALALCALLLLITPALAGQRLTVGVECLDYPPYGSIQNGEYRGYARDLLDAFAIEYGYDLVYDPLPVKRLYQDFLVTRILDLKFPDSKDWHPGKRKGLAITYSDPVCEYTDGIHVKPENLGRGVKGIRVLGIIAGFKPWLLKPIMNPKDLTVSENASISGLLGKALIDRVDAVYANEEAVRHLLAAMGLKGRLVMDPALPHKTDVYHLSTINRPEVLREFNEFMKTHRELVDSIKKKHGLMQ
ncbi:hypothetical protein [Pseudodesulfovibrio sp. S3]|nr:hypothetical protein [Pseudodesulfovibrio sp. S3]MCJ2165614.1 transporter substrate-binding domain-containing protein [Pseudodesulfovibrio sp. S3-i]RWU03022.1 hypothetical protein DWB63_13315 [Pseudodesulfovibrio sp. S3]